MPTIILTALEKSYMEMVLQECQRVILQANAFKESKLRLLFVTHGYEKLPAKINIDDKEGVLHLSWDDEEQKGEIQ